MRNLLFLADFIQINISNECDTGKRYLSMEKE